MEKPLLEKAQVYLISGDYLWNIGIFVCSAKSIQKAFQKYAAEIDALFSKRNTAYNTSGELNFINKNYPKSPNIPLTTPSWKKRTMSIQYLPILAGLIWVPGFARNSREG